MKCLSASTDEPLEASGAAAVHWPLHCDQRYSQHSPSNQSNLARKLVAFTACSESPSKVSDCETASAAIECEPG